MSDKTYFERMAEEAEIRAEVLFRGRATTAENQKVEIDRSSRREVEAFAARLDDLGVSEIPAHQSEYARIDASAMLRRLASGNDAALSDLQQATLSQDMTAFVGALEKHRIGRKADRDSLQHFIAKQDREAIAACIRMIAQSTTPLEEEMQPGQRDTGIEVVDVHGKTIYYQSRRAKCTAMLHGNNIWNPASVGKSEFKMSEVELLAAYSLGTDAENVEWEQKLEFNAMMINCANACQSIMEEAAGYGNLDGRIEAMEEAKAHKSWWSSEHN